MSDVVRVEREGAVAVVSLNRPEKLNAVSNDVFAGLYEAGQQVASDDAVRAVLLRGEGRSFCAGLDLNSLAGFGGRTNGDDASGVGFVEAQGGFSCWQTMDKPVVAAVQGHALGAGFQLALAADIRVVAEDVTMSVFEITYGLIPDLGGTQLLPPLVGAARAKELIWTARKFGASQAEAWGLANSVVSVDALEKEAMAMATDLASRPPIPIALSKRLVEQAGTVPLTEGMMGERKGQATCLTSNDMREAVAAAFEKREATYTGT